MSCCDQTNQNLDTCVNPCAVSTANTAACESLPSQISNFTLDFYGEITKTEVDGKVRWITPCSLQAGLENNPRQSNEGLACYFIRLFEEGIIGATGPAGPAGADGAKGNNAYTVTTQTFTQPTLGSPNVVLKTSYNPSIITSLYIFVQGSGWYLVTNTDFSGNVWATLQRPLSGVSGSIGAGRLVVPAGYPGESVVGPTGPQGPQGPQGDAGESYTETNDQVDSTNSYPAGTDYSLQVAYQAVNFVVASPQVLLPNKGTYKITCTVALEGQAGVLTTDDATVKLYNVSNAADVASTEQVKNDFSNGSKDQLVIDTIYTTDGANQTVALYGKCSTAGAVDIIAARTVLNYVQLA